MQWQMSSEGRNCTACPWAPSHWRARCVSLWMLTLYSGHHVSHGLLLEPTTTAWGPILMCANTGLLAFTISCIFFPFNLPPPFWNKTINRLVPYHLMIQVFKLTCMLLFIKLSPFLATKLYVNISDPSVIKGIKYNYFPDHFLQLQVWSISRNLAINK